MTGPRRTRPAALPRRLRTVLARWDSSCVACGTLTLAGDAICGPIRLTIDAPRPVGRHPRRIDGTLASNAWVHEACVPTLYRVASQPLPVVAPLPAPTPAPTTPRAPMPCGHHAVYMRGPLAGSCRACARYGTPST